MIRILAKNLGKDYRLYAHPSQRFWEAVLRRPRHQVYRALDDVSFSVLSGTCLGVIGDNGAGKSTLLKLIVGTLTPTRGSLEVHGRVTSILELGAGFHPDFTGRRNITLNASLLGLTAQEISALEPHILAFAELGEFIDRPVRTYSSGMVVRLAFSIAVSADPDILVIDEALAVGDIAFQRKCIDRMLDFRSRGKTLVFCSHSMYHVRELCHQVLWLDAGRVRMLGDTSTVVSAYEEYSRFSKTAGARPENNGIDPGQPRSSGLDCVIESLWLEDASGQPTQTLPPLAEVFLCMRVLCLKDHVTPQFGFAIVDVSEEILAGASTHHDGVRPGPFQAGERIQVRLRIPFLPLRQGVYRITGAVGDKAGLLWYESKHLPGVGVAEGGKGIGRITFPRHWEFHKDDEGTPTL